MSNLRVVDVIGPFEAQFDAVGNREDFNELRAMWTLVTTNDGRMVLPKLLGYIAERRRHRERWVRPLVEPSAPIRLINGSLDPVSGAHMVARYRELVPNGDVVVLPDVGHYPQVEAPDAVLAAVLTWFARRSQ